MGKPATHCIRVPAYRLACPPAHEDACMPAADVHRQPPKKGILLGSCRSHAHRPQACNCRGAALLATSFARAQLNPVHAPHPPAGMPTCGDLCRDTVKKSVDGFLSSVTGEK